MEVVEVGSYFSKSTFIVTQIKQEKLVFILVILYIWEYMFSQNCLKGPGYLKISGIRFPK